MVALVSKARIRVELTWEAGAPLGSSCGALRRRLQAHCAVTQNFRQQGRREFGRRGVLFLYVEVDGRLRTQPEGIFSS